MLHPTLEQRAEAWNRVLSIKPGDIDLHIPKKDITGVIPAGLHGGRLLSNGPGWNKYEEQVIHPFDGHGYLRAFEFLDDGSVSFRARFIQTKVYQEESKLNTFKYRGFATNPSNKFWKNIGFSVPRNVANTTIYRWNNQLLAGWEGGAPHAIDPISLETIGIETFDDIIAGKTTLAHMNHDPETNRLIVANTQMGRDTGLVFHEFDTEGQHIQTQTGHLNGPAFVHDFIFSKNWYIVGGNPLSIDLWKAGKAFMGMGTLLTSVSANTDKPGEIVLISRQNNGQIRHIKLPKPVFVVHFVNAFEKEDGTLIVDACIFHDFPFGEEFGYSGRDKPFDPSLPEKRGPQSLYRITVKPENDTGTWSKLADHGVDFPRVLPQFKGTEAPFMVGATRADLQYSDPFDSLFYLNLTGDTVPPSLWTTTSTTFIGEPIPIRDNTTQMDYVAVILADGLKEETTLALFDTNDITKGPVCKIPLPLLPIAFHGEWDSIGSRLST